MANIEDVYKRLNELHAEILRITIAGVLDQATEAKQDELISVVSKEAKQDAHTVIFNSINDVLDQMELNQDQQSAILNAINASITDTNLKLDDTNTKLDDVNTELDNISATDFATSAKQEDVKTKLDTIITNTDTNATEAKQDTIIGHVDGIEGTLTSIDNKDFATSAKQDTQILNEETIISELGVIKTNTPVFDFEIGDTPQLILVQIRTILNNMIEEQRTTNKLLRKIYNPK
jgi:hypothetical protein